MSENPKIDKEYSKASKSSNEKSNEQNKLQPSNSNTEQKKQSQPQQSKSSTIAKKRKRDKESQTENEIQSQSRKKVQFFLEVQPMTSFQQTDNCYLRKLNCRHEQNDVLFQMKQPFNKFHDVYISMKNESLFYNIVMNLQVLLKKISHIYNSYKSGKIYEKRLAFFKLFNEIPFFIHTETGISLL
jgi:DNA mismatch repair ATPase MutL